MDTYHDMTHQELAADQGIEFVMALRELITAKRSELMDEALEDYYGI